MAFATLQPLHRAAAPRCSKPFSSSTLLEGRAPFAQRAAAFACAAEAETAATETEASIASAPAATTSSSPGSDDDWVPVIAPEELPKGVRKEIAVNGRSVLLFWYRNQIYAISARSPAEGAYSEGFIKAKFTQDYGIICPQTGSIFSLKDGSIVEWYPSNPVLRSITPESGNLPIYPVKLTQDAIMVNVGDGAAALAGTRGGADTSLENNNVFAVQPSVYQVGSDRDEGSFTSSFSTAATLSVAITFFAIVATAGTATALYFEDYTLLGGFWLLMIGGGGYFAWQFQQGRSEAEAGSKAE